MVRFPATGNTNNIAGDAQQQNLGGRPLVADVAQIASNHAYILVGSERSDGIIVYINGDIIPNGSLESLSVNIAIPDQTNGQGTVTAILSYYEQAAPQTGNDDNAGGGTARGVRSVALFPGSVEILAQSKRISVTAQQENSFEGLWLGVGMNADGTSNEVHGVRSLRVLVTPDLTDAQLVWDEDGVTEAIFPRVGVDGGTPQSFVNPDDNRESKGGLFTAFGR